MDSMMAAIIRNISLIDKTDPNCGEVTSIEWKELIGAEMFSCEAGILNPAADHYHYRINDRIVDAILHPYSCSS